MTTPPEAYDMVRRQIPLPSPQGVFEPPPSELGSSEAEDREEPGMHKQVDNATYLYVRVYIYYVYLYMHIHSMCNKHLSICLCVYMYIHTCAHMSV